VLRAVAVARRSLLVLILLERRPGPLKLMSPVIGNGLTLLSVTVPKVLAYSGGDLARARRGFTLSVNLSLA
jgi:hypothetical protein